MQTANQCQDGGKCNAEQCGYRDAFAHACFILRTTALSEANTESSGKTVNETEHKINDDADIDLI